MCSEKVASPALAMTKTFKFSLVARGVIPLAKYPTDNADIYDKAIKILHKIDLRPRFL
jgi:hypothetical protein